MKTSIIMRLHSKTGNCFSSAMKQALPTILTVILLLVLLLALLWGIQQLITLAAVSLLVPQDWTVSLPNGYAIWRINSEQIILVKAAAEGGYDTVVDTYINAYFCDTRYIGLWCAAGGSEDLLGVAPEQDRYYLVDTQDDLRCGPLSYSEYTSLCDKHALFGFDAWTKTNPVPPDAAYP